MAAPPRGTQGSGVSAETQEETRSLAHSPPAVQAQADFPVSLSFFNYRKTSTSYFLSCFLHPKPTQGGHLERVHLLCRPS